jgi:tetratricopeptide (TPR) repeat protein
MPSAIVDERMQRLFTLDKMSRQLVFTDITKAQKYLGEQQEILVEFDQPDFRLSYHLNTALIENQLYNYTLSDIHFRMALEILGERGDVNQLAEAYIDYAGTLLNLEQIDRSRFYLSQAAKYLETYPDDRLKVRLICREGFFSLKISNYAKALQAFLDAERQMKSFQQPLEFKDYYFYTLIQSGLGTIYAINNDPEKSIQAYLEVVNFCEKKGIRSRLSWHYLNVGNGYMAIQDYDNASFYFKSAIKVVDDVNQQARALAYANLGYCYLSKGQNKEALELLATAYPLFKEKRDKNLANIEWWRARIFEEEKAKKALKHYLNALDFAKKAQDYKMISGILKDISALYAKEQEYKYAYDYQLLYDQAVEKYLFEQKDSELRELQVKYEAEWKEKEVEMFKLQASGLQLKALRAQMNPHFVFNALNSVQNFITSNDGKLAAKYLAQFAHLTRQSLEYSELEIISLEKEIDFLRNYLEINEKLRFENKLRYEINVDEEIEEDILGVPTMIIQPYVENSIEHGIRSKENGLIKVNFTLKDENTILCTVEDNGIGRNQAKEVQQNNPNFKNHRSLGTKITQERLEILLKSKNREEKVVDIIDLIDEQTGKAMGTRVEILIPIMDIQMK